MTGLEQAIVEAAQVICKLMTEEDIHILASYYAHHYSPEQANDWAAKMIDLGQAVQEYEQP